MSGSSAPPCVEPQTEEIRKSAAMYLAMAGVMEDHNAQAITVNCLGGVYSNKWYPPIPALDSWSWMTGAL